MILRFDCRHALTTFSVLQKRFNCTPLSNENERSLIWLSCTTIIGYPVMWYFLCRSNFEGIHFACLLRFYAHALLQSSDIIFTFTHKCCFETSTKEIK